MYSGVGAHPAEPWGSCAQPFLHDACGDDPAADVRAAGYDGPWGENLYREGRLGAPRVALDGWLNSPEHRENLFTPTWQTDGIAATTAAHIGKYSDVTIWVNQFGSDEQYLPRVKTRLQSPTAQILRRLVPSGRRTPDAACSRRRKDD